MSRLATTALSLSFVIALSVQPGLIGTALASGVAACGINVGMYQAGQQVNAPSGRTMTMARGTLEGQLLVPCTGGSTGDGVTFLWSSIVTQGACQNCILQIGLGKAVGQSEKWYYAWGRSQSYAPCHNYQDHLPGATELGTYDGQSHAYRIMIDPVLPYWDFQIDGQTQFQISTPQVCWPTNALYMFGEKYEYGSELGGNVSNPQTISDVRWHLDGSSNLHVPSWTVGADCASAGIRPPDWCQNSGSAALDIWSVFP